MSADVIGPMISGILLGAGLFMLAYLRSRGRR